MAGQTFNLARPQGAAGCQDPVRAGAEIDWPVPFWWVDIGATMQTIMLAAVDEGLGCGFMGPEIDGLRAYLGIPDEFVPIGVMPIPLRRAGQRA